MHKPILLAFAGIIASTLPATAAVAGDAALEKRIAELEQTVRLLSRKLEVQDEVYQADKAKAAPNGKVKASADGISIVSADSQYEIKFKALAQVDGRFGIHDDKDSDSFLYRRLRPTLEGKIGPRVGFRITPEFAEDDADIVDGYIDVLLPLQSSLRAGQFKPPVGLERLQSGGALIFVERAFPTELAPNRDRGLQLTHWMLDRRLSVELALTSGTADGRTATNVDGDGEQEINARVFFEPKPGIGFGIAGSRGEKFGTGNAYLPRYRSPAQQTIFQYRSNVAANGDHTRITPQAYAFAGPFGLMAEYIESKQDLSRGALDQTFRNDAWQVTAVYALTGEDESFKGILRPLHPHGAVELALRYAELNVDDDAFTSNFADASLQVGGRAGMGGRSQLDHHAKPESHRELHADAVRRRRGGRRRPRRRESGLHAPAAELLITHHSSRSIRP